VKITTTDPHTFSRRFIRARRDQDVVMDCFVENLPPLTTVSLLEFVNLDMESYIVFIFVKFLPEADYFLYLLGLCVCCKDFVVLLF